VLVTAISESNTHVMIVAMRTVFIAVLVDFHVLPESLLAFLANENHLAGLCERMLFLFSMTFSTVKPLLAAWCPNRDLSVQDVFAAAVV
jgi:hypothetical protein